MQNKEYSLYSIFIIMHSGSDIMGNTMLLDCNLLVCLAPSLTE